ncbi:MAG: TPR end-of-group domain-containing protein, partial [Myxococcales bacterium]
RDGERELKRAAELDPLDWIPLHGLGWTYLGQGRYSEARSAFERARDLCRDPEFEGQNLATVAVLQGDRQLAAAWDGKASAPADASWSRAAVAEFLKRSDAPEAMRAFVEQFGAAQPFDVAELYGLRGDANNAFIWLERALAARDRYLRMVKIDPSFRTLRSDPRWPVLLAKMNLRP